jgi:hypothetical protein
VTILAGSAGDSNGGIFFIGFAKSNYAGMRIMADNTVNGNVFALEEFFILLMVFDETTTSIDSLLAIAPVAITTRIAGAIHFQSYAMGILCMQ